GIKGEDAFALISSGVQATGLDTDKAADMVKEFFLTLTDGSTTSKDAFKEIGLNIDDLNKQIDSGSITSAEAMQKVMKAITEVGSETEQARILQEIFKGTIEYGSIEVVEAWANMEQGVVDTTGAIDGAKEAYEGSYEAMKQDLTQSWDELTQTIGSAVLPSLLDIVQSLLKIPFNMELAGTQMSLAWGWTVAQLSNAWLGFVGVCHEGIISILTAMQSSASAMGMDGVAESLGTNIDIIKGKHDELVGKIKTNEETIKNNSDILGQLWNNSWSGTLEENKTTFRTIMGEIETDAKKTNTNVGTSIDGASKKISTSTGKAKTDAKKNFKDINQSAKSELDGVKGSVDSNMDGSAKKVQQEATNMYKGVKTSFNKMNQCAREDGTKMYQGVTTSANKMASNAKTAATNMYKGVTGSTSKMAQKAISDWNRVRDAFSKSISGTIKTTKKTIISKPEKEEKTSIYDGYIQNVDTSRYNLDGAYYKDTSLESKAISQHLRINNDSSILNGTIKELNKLSNDLGKNNSKEDIKLYLELPIIADGREFARISAKYMDGELKIINNRENRKRGV
ncbi:MAG: phage tail tape measure protein, partial [Clostridium sp.]